MFPASGRSARRRGEGSEGSSELELTILRHTPTFTYTPSPIAFLASDSPRLWRRRTHNTHKSVRHLRRLRPGP